jgi:hypothetical protein
MAFLRIAQIVIRSNSFPRLKALLDPSLGNAMEGSGYAFFCATGSGS